MTRPRIISGNGIIIRNSYAPGISSIGGLEQKYDQNLQRGISFESGIEIHAVNSGNCFTHCFDHCFVHCSDHCSDHSSAHCSVHSSDNRMEEFPLTILGLFQQIEVTGGTIAASGPDGEPLLVCLARGRGKVWYLAGTPAKKSLLMLLDILYEKTGVTRHLRVTDPDGRRVEGIEARLARREFDDLVYIVNGSERDVEFVIKTDRPVHRIRELRSLRYWPGLSGKIKKDDVLIFSLQENPSARYCRTAEAGNYI